MSLRQSYINLPLLLILLGFLTQAKCDNRVQNIPYVPVNFDINLNLPAYNSLNFPGEHIYVDGGSNGLIIYRYTLDDFVVLDRHATSDIQMGCQVNVTSDGLTINDNCYTGLYSQFLNCLNFIFRSGIAGTCPTREV